MNSKIKISRRSFGRMVLDFTLQKYRELCEAVLENYKPLTVRSYLVEKPTNKFVILRHDVDKKPESALKLAKLESELGIRSTYYFRMKKDVFKPDIIKKIAKMGHEVGYHYEVLDKARGDLDKAIKIFEEELKRFRKVCDVYTICMHGNPLTPWLNGDLWKKYDYRDFSILGEAYLSIDFNEIVYFSDTGRTWNSKYNVKDFKSSESIKNTDNLISLLNKRKFKRIYILTHPNRWSDNPVDWFIELISQNIKNIGKLGIKLLRRLL